MLYKNIFTSISFFNFVKKFLKICYYKQKWISLSKFNRKNIIKSHCTLILRLHLYNSWLKLLFISISQRIVLLWLRYESLLLRQARSKRRGQGELELVSFSQNLSAERKQVTPLCVIYFQTRRLFEGGVYSNKNQRFQTNDFFSAKELIFLHPRSYLLPRQNQVTDLAGTHSQYWIHLPGMDQFQVFWRWMPWLSAASKQNAALNRGRGLLKNKSKQCGTY